MARQKRGRRSRSAAAATDLGEGWPAAPGVPCEVGPWGFLGAGAQAWTAWVYGAKVLGREGFEINGMLRELGTAGAHAAVEAVLAHPAAREGTALRATLPALRRRAAFVAQMGLSEVETLSEEEFRERFFLPQRPVVFRGGAGPWPVWSFADLVSRWGDIEIDVTVDRTGSWWQNRVGRTRTMTLSALVELAQSGDPAAAYCVGQNRLFRHIPGVSPEIGHLPGLSAERPRPGVWIGPRGTFTPLHFDSSSGWLVQRVGEKRVWLGSPFEHRLHETAIDRCYNSARLDELDSDVGVFEIVLRPDDALFIPALWWHQVESLTPSISVSLCAWALPDGL